MDADDRFRDEAKRHGDSNGRDADGHDPASSTGPEQQQPHAPELFETFPPDEPPTEPPSQTSAQGSEQTRNSERGTAFEASGIAGQRPPARPSSRKRAGRDSGQPGNNGAELERRVGRLEFAEGALSRCRVPVFVDAEAGRDILTDLDVLSLDFDNRLRLSRSTLECKSGRGQSGEGDRLLWLSGLRTLLDIDRAVLVRHTITRRGRVLAAALDLQIIDTPTLSQRESAHAWLPDRFAHIDGPACSSAEKRSDVQLRGLGHVPPKLVAFLRHQSLLAPSHRILAALVALRRATEQGGVLPTPTNLILAGHALQSLTLAALQDAVTLDNAPVQDLQRRIELALTVGSPDDDHVLSVLGRADEVMRRVMDQVHRAYVEQGANRMAVNAPSLRQLIAVPPDWVERYLDLVKRLRANPAIAHQLPQTIELACFDALLGDHAYQASAFDHLFTTEHRNLLLACVRMVDNVAGSQVADAVASITTLDYSRFAPTLPDRTAQQGDSPTSATPPPPARRAD